MLAAHLRPATADDADTIATIWYDGWRDGHLGHVPEELVAIRTAESFRSRAPRRIADTVVAATGAGAETRTGPGIAGFVMVVGDEVEQVYVAAAHRGSGVAGLLLTEAERLVAAGGHRRAWLAVFPANVRARRFYERRGWADDGLFEYRAVAPGGTIVVPCHRYVKNVRPDRQPAAG